MQRHFINRMKGDRLRADFFKAQMNKKIIHMQKKRLTVIRSIIIVVLIVIAFSFSIFAYSLKSSAFTPHAPIFIEGDLNFTGANGVTGGSGTQLDPYLIPGWEINNSAQNGIEVRNTTAHFKIQGVYVHSGTLNANDCIHFSNVTNGSIDNSDMAYYANYAVYIEHSANCTIVDSRFVGPPSALFLPYGIYIYDSDNFTISNNLFYRTGTCIQFQNSNNHRAVGNNFTTVGDAVIIQACDNVTVHQNDATNVSSYGIASFGSTNLTITNNNLTINDYTGIGIYLSSSNVTISGNNLTDNDVGIYTQNSRDLNISNNIVLQSENFGIQIDRTSNVTVSGNNLTSCGITLWGFNLNEYNTHTIPSDNLVNGKTVYYYKNTAGIDIDGLQMGGLILVNCTDCSIANLQMSNADMPLEIAYVNNTVVSGCNLSSNNRASLFSWSSDNINITGNNLSNNSVYGMQLNSQANKNNITIYNNTISSNYLEGIIMNRMNQITIMSNLVSFNGQNGMWLQNCNWGNITDNNFTNNVRGVYLDFCQNLMVYANNFINNGVQASERLSPNAWDAGYPTGGNYWDDYTGVDLFKGPAQNIPGSDGIGDTPHDFGGFTNDSYPLMTPIPEFSEIVVPLGCVILLFLAGRRISYTRKENKS